MERERLYLHAWRLNAVKIINALADIVKNQIVDVWPYVPLRKYTVVSPDNSERDYDYRSYLSFQVDGVYYYVQLGDNPFLDWLFVKEVAVNGTISAGADGAVLPYDWYIGEDVYAELSDEKAWENAKSLYAWLTEAEVTNKYPKKNRRKFRIVA